MLKIGWDDLCSRFDWILGGKVTSEELPQVFHELLRKDPLISKSIGSKTLLEEFKVNRNDINLVWTTMNSFLKDLDFNLISDFNNDLTLIDRLHHYELKQCQRFMVITSLSLVKQLVKSIPLLEASIWISSRWFSSSISFVCIYSIFNNTPIILIGVLEGIQYGMDAGKIAAQNLLEALYIDDLSEQR